MFVLSRVEHRYVCVIKGGAQVCLCYQGWSTGMFVLSRVEHRYVCVIKGGVQVCLCYQG